MGRLTTAVSDVDIAGALASSSHLSPYGGATCPTTDTRLNPAGGVISTSLLALPDTSV